jgi:hypothetical protein
MPSGFFFLFFFVRRRSEAHATARPYSVFLLFCAKSKSASPKQKLSPVCGWEKVLCFGEALLDFAQNSRKTLYQQCYQLSISTVVRRKLVNNAIVGERLIPSPLLAFS